MFRFVYGKFRGSSVEHVLFCFHSVLTCVSKMQKNKIFFDVEGTFKGGMSINKAVLC